MIFYSNVELQKNGDLYTRDNYQPKGKLVHRFVS